MYTRCPMTRNIFHSSTYKNQPAYHTESLVQFQHLFTRNNNYVMIISIPFSCSQHSVPSSIIILLSIPVVCQDDAKILKYLPSNYGCLPILLKPFRRIALITGTAINIRVTNPYVAFSITSYSLPRITSRKPYN